MSTSKKYYSASEKVPPEKSSFVMTCNRLSLYLKEKGSLRDLGINANFDVIGKPEMSSQVTQMNTTTVDLLSNMESPVQTSAKTEKSINRLPQYVSLDSFCKPDHSTNKAVSREPVAATESKTSQMTIFYRGEVLVFDSISDDKARSLMLAASGASSSNNQIQNRIQLTSTSNSPGEDFGSQEKILPGLQGNGSDLPIARRASLHKFLAKRKDRATVSAPYQLQNPLLAVQSSKHKFDLNL